MRGRLEDMPTILYLHGFGEMQPATCCPVAWALRRALPAAVIEAPCYHPDGSVRETRLEAALLRCEQIIRGTDSGHVHLVGYSFGGLLVSLLAWRRPELIESVLLLAPAIDNFDRNYAGRNPDQWRMPEEYVNELRSLPARPPIVRPTTLVHGTLEDDTGGAAIWRVKHWAAQERFDQVYYPNLDHSLQPWLSMDHWIDGEQEPPAFGDLARQLVARAPVN
jgi:pimeloyl-ACP methyl ester carboxylesterase